MESDELAGSYAAKLDSYFQNERPEMFDYVPATAASVLDVGCSTGMFGGLIKARRPDCEVWGIDIHPASATDAARRIDKAICGPFSKENHELAGRRFDCIVFNDVLEHMVYPQEALHVAAGLLTNTGKVVASIPNVLHFYNILKVVVEQDWKYEKEGIMDETHLRFFSRKSIVRLFEESGFAIERLEGINPSYGLKYSLVNALTLNRLFDWRFVQFAVVASPRV